MPARPHVSTSAAVRFAVAAALSAAVAGPLFAPPVSWAAAPPAGAATPDSDSFPQPFEGKLKADALLFSGAGLQFYPTMRVKAGQTVVATGLKNKDWLKIVPPEGSFSYVPKAYVERHGQGDRGKVTHPGAIVKAGSEMQPAKHAVQTKLEVGDDVTILGEEDEYFKIKPPAGALVYVNKDAVAMVGPVGGATADAPPATGGAPDATGAAAARPKPPEGAAPPAADPGTPITTMTPVGPSTRGAVAVAPPPPSTRPGEADLVTQLQTLETDFAEASKKPLVDQPVAELGAGYQKLAETPGVPEAVRRIAEVRLTTLRVRAEAQEQFTTLQKQQQEAQQRLTAQRAEKDEIEQRIKDIDIQVFAAVGTLRTSSLQVAKTPIYRLTDPQTGRTVVYVWGTDAKIAELIGQFVGVKGPMQTDARLNLKVITPNGIEAVDPKKVNTSVAAEITPPSLLPKGTSASTAGN